MRWITHWLRTIPIIYCFRYWKLKYIDIVLKHPPGWKIHLQSMTRWPSAWRHCRPLPALQTCERCLMMFKLEMTQRRRSLWMSIPSSGFCGSGRQPGCGVSALADGAGKGAHVLEMWNYCRNIFKHCLHVCPILWPLAPHHFLTLSPCANVANKSAETLRIVLHSVFILTRAFWNTFTGSKWH